MSASTNTDLCLMDGLCSLMDGPCSLMDGLCFLEDCCWLRPSGKDNVQKKPNPV